MRRMLRWLAAVSASALAAGALADVTLPALIGDNMVLQRGRPARLWGWADPDEKVTVAASWQADRVYTTAGADRRWSLAIPTPDSPGPHTLTISGHNQITLQQVLVGEVWVCAGQSNMQMCLRAYPNGYTGILNADAEIAAADFPAIRLFTVGACVATEPRDDCTGQWLPCAPDSVRDFSATAYFFGRELHRELGVPVGLIHASWGGTRAEAWMSPEALSALGVCTAELADLPRSPTPENVALQQQAEAVRERQRYLLDARNEGLDKGFADVDFDTTGWRRLVVPAAWETAGADMNIDGVVWFRREVVIPAGWAGQNLELSLGPVEDCDTTYFNGRRLGATGYGTADYWQAPRRYQVPASFLRPGERNVIAVRVFDDGWNGGLTGRPDQLMLRPLGDASPKAVELAGPWRYQVEAVLPPNPVRLAEANTATALFNGMLHPLLPQVVRGAIWYQGEANVWNAAEYRRIFPGLVADWRRAWGTDDFPFYYVQIAPWNYPQRDAAALVREAQAQALAVPGTGMVVTTDIGDIADIHPRNKQEVGRRLGLLALARTYGRDVVCSGPVYRAMKVEGDAIRIVFDEVGGGLEARNGPLHSFAIAGENRTFVPAEARIDGETVIVSSPRVPQPVAVRFGWSNIPTPNLFNQAGLPASPFRTDDWGDAVNAAVLDVVRSAADDDGQPPEAEVEIDLNAVLVEDFQGVGVQWSAYPWWDVSDADWEKVFQRLEYMRLPLTRVMLDAFWYCQGFDAAGEPIYTWDTPHMRKLQRLLDWCERRGVTVVVGEWGRPNGADLDLPVEDSRWTRIIADFLDYMLNTRGYTCLRYYNLINEPHGHWTGVSWEAWSTAITNLQAELARRGLLDRIRIAAPDADRNFTTRFLKQPPLRALTGVYDEHWYVRVADVERGLVELFARDQLRQVQRRDPGKPFILGELGVADGVNHRDQQLNVYAYWYGVAMGDAAIQAIRGGLSGVVAWDLDDAMHFYADGGESMNALGEPLPFDAYDRRKIWGFWNILGAEHGDPADERMRPWFFPWAVLARTFPPGCQPVVADDSGVDGLRVAAARVRADGAWHLSCAVANNAPWPRRLRLAAPRAGAATTLGVYVYSDINGDNAADAWPQTVDPQGDDVFPDATQTVAHADLAEGLQLYVPPRSIIVLTSLEYGAPIPLAGAD